MDYNFFLNTKTSAQWQRTGTEKRSGIAVPLFSIYSKDSTGTGDFSDLKKMVEWCADSGFSIIQLLPLNDTGNDFAPYNALSSFALDPMYIDLNNLKYVNKNKFSGKIEKLKKEFPNRNERVNYGIKKAKIKLLEEMFASLEDVQNPDYGKYILKNKYWLESYSLYKVLRDISGDKPWESWDEEFTNENALKDIAEKFADKLAFYGWIQWQAFEQLREAKAYAKEKGVLLLGDIPLLVSRDSADVWSNKNYFHLDLSSGAPPDVYFSKGQRWGMPPYNLVEIEKDGFEYFRRKLKYAENFYDMFRIDHFVGILRLWVIKLTEPEETCGLNGKFIPEEDFLWEPNAKKILDVIVNSSSMLPCAEDLGTVPDVSYKILFEYGIPGIDIQRWKKHWGGDYEFVKPEDYRANSVSSISTHDSSFFPVWWKYEAGSVDEMLFVRLCDKLKLPEDNYSKLFIKKNCGRLLWNDNVQTVEHLLSILGKKWDEAFELVNLYVESFGEKNKYLKYLYGVNTETEKINSGMIKKNLERINESKSIFSIQQIFEYLYLDENILEKYSDYGYRINQPGLISESNWSLRIPFPLEELKTLEINKTIRDLNYKSRK